MVIDGKMFGLPTEAMSSVDESKFSALNRHTLPCELCKKEIAGYMLWNEKYGKHWIFLGDVCYKRYRSDSVDDVDETENNTNAAEGAVES